MAMLRPVSISVLAVDTKSKSPVVVLKEIAGERTLPVWIGFMEANAIGSELEGIKFSRPMTHDLVKDLLVSVDAKVKKIVVHDLKKNTYYAFIHLDYAGKEIIVDARPSDALALSLRFKAPIFVEEDVFKKAEHVSFDSEEGDKSEEKRKWHKILEKMDPDDFGNA
jgi:bifunctional DNase/RNase